MGRPIMYSPEVRERAVRLVSEHRGEHRSETDKGERPGLSSDQLVELGELRRENRELRRANEILRKASAYFAQAELDRRPRK